MLEKVVLIAVLANLVCLSAASPGSRFEYLGYMTKPGAKQDFDGSRYYASAFAGIWTNSVQDCKDTFGPSGHLVSIESEAEALGLNAWLEDRGSGGSTFWTSGSFTFDKGWIWLPNANEAIFTAWNDDQPGARPNTAQRIALVHLNRFSAGWDAMDNTATIRYICEVETVNP